MQPSCKYFLVPLQQNQKIMKLSELKTGEKGIIVKVLGHGGFRKRIIEMGFVRGKEVDVLLNAPLQDPVKYKLMGYEVSLRHQEADMIEVVSMDTPIEMTHFDMATDSSVHHDDYIQHEALRERRVIRVALVGYTNVGKSTIMNMLAKSEVFAENKLFATLDTTVRKVVIENLPFLLADTVGFIRKLPTDLVDSFKSTLDETREADLLVHVVDISHPDFEEQIKVVEKTLGDLGCADKPSMIVFNKIDAYTWKEKEEDDLTPVKKDEIPLEELKKTWMARMNGGDNCLFISAREKQNIDEFKNTLYKKVRELHVQKYPYNDFLWTNPEES